MKKILFVAPTVADLNPIEYLWDEVERVTMHPDKHPLNIIILESSTQIIMVTDFTNDFLASCRVHSKIINAVFSWLKSLIRVHERLNMTYLNIVANQLHLLMFTVYTDGM